MHTTIMWVEIRDDEPMGSTRGFNSETLQMPVRMFSGYTVLYSLLL